MARKGLGGVGFRNCTTGTGRPEAEDLWREQGQHAIITCVIVELRGSSQLHQGKIQQETLSKIVRSPVRRWPELNVRDCVIQGEREHMENRTPRDPRYSVGAIENPF